ncbi:CHAT domain-containing protein [Capilliphycus salinus ALCB114379]|uniref:CHAT domain-containing protein n=1 Tax=Capilliphycus salinus TaxID=2768948 RepID=UPI0039A44715
MRAGQIEIQGIYSDGLQQGGNISITNEGENNINILSPLQTFSEEGIAGEITLSSSGNINTQSMNSEGLQQGGNISITSSAGEINTIGQLNSFSLEGTAGNVTLNAAGHIEIQGIRSEGLQHGGDISITSDSQNSINILGNLDTFSQRGEAGKITLDSPGNITTQNVRSYGQTESGDLIITSQGSISTGSVTTEATGGSSGNIIINGQEVVAGNVSSIGTLSAGKIQIEATDGSIRTLDLTSRSTEGNAGGIDLDATEDINTEDQIVYSKKGNAEIDINAGNDINIKGDQRATTEEGSPSIRNNAENRINIDGEQMATTRNGNALIRNVARNGINVGEQTAIGTERATIENITTGGSITTGPQNAIENGQPGTIINQEGDSNPTNLEPIQPTFDNPEINRPATLAEDSNLPRPTPDPPENPQFNSENPGLINNENVDNRNNTLVQRASEELRTEISNSPEGNNSDEKQSSDISYSSSEVLNVLNSNSVSPLAIASADMVTNLEYNRNQEFSRYFGDDFANTNLSTENVRTVLDDIAQQTGIHSAVIYVTVQTNQLELVVFTAEGKPKFHRIEVPREEVLKVARNFYNEVASPIRSRRYLKPAQQLYDWLIRPLESQLQAEGIDTILLSLDSGLRGLPLAALHDGQQFLIEKYSLSLIPSISLMDTRYTSLKNSKVLGMGASEFLELDSLPSVPVELETVTQRLWQGQQFLNQEFTRENLINQRKKYPYQIIHLATHSDFTVGNPADSYIQLWEDDQLKLDELRTLGWQNPPVELLVLSSCRTGVGDEQAEIGFAGLAIKAGVKSALASLWYVNDVGTLALITEFYAHLDNVVIKADALRQAQLMMIQGQVKIQDSQWQGSEPDTSIVLPPQLNSIGNFDFSHPYYWSGFTMIGSPW